VTHKAPSGPAVSVAGIWPATGPDATRLSALSAALEGWLTPLVWFGVLCGPLGRCGGALSWAWHRVGVRVFSAVVVLPFMGVGGCVVRMLATPVGDVGRGVVVGG